MNFVNTSLRNFGTMCGGTICSGSPQDFRFQVDSKLLASSATIVLLFLMVIATPAIADSSRPEGFTEPLQTIDIASSESGVIATIAVGEGDAIFAGDVVCTLRSDVLEATRDAMKTRLSATGKLAAAAATLAHRENHLQQLQALHAKSHASEQEVAEADFNVRIARAQRQSVEEERSVLQSELQQIDAQIATRTLRSPIDGIVLELPAKIGERVGSSDAPVARVVSLHQLRVRYHLPTAEAAYLKKGDTQTIYFSDSQRRTFALVDFIAPTTDSSSGTVRVELLIDNTSGQYRAGVRCLLLAPEMTGSLRPFLRQSF